MAMIDIITKHQTNIIVTNEMLTQDESLGKAVRRWLYNIAKAHAKKNNLDITYLNGVPEGLDTQNKFDIILNLEVVEHV